MKIYLQQKNYRLLYFATIPQGKALKMGQTLLTFIESSAFKARLEQAEVLKSYSLARGKPILQILKVKWSLNHTYGR